MRDHGGNLDVAMKRFGGRLEDWIDLSTGINRRPYPVGELPLRSWTALPSRAELDALPEAARQAFPTRWGGAGGRGRASRDPDVALLRRARARPHPCAHL